MEALEEALAQGVLEVAFADGRKVRFSSFEELVNRYNFWAKRAGEDAGRQRMFAEYRKGVRS